MTLAVPELSRRERLTTNDLVAGSSVAETVLGAGEVVVVSGGDEGEREVGEDDPVSERVPGLERDEREPKWKPSFLSLRLTL